MGNGEGIEPRVRNRVDSIEGYMGGGSERGDPRIEHGQSGVGAGKKFLIESSGSSQAHRVGKLAIGRQVTEARRDECCPAPGGTSEERHQRSFDLSVIGDGNHHHSLCAGTQNSRQNVRSKGLRGSFTANAGHGFYQELFANEQRNFGTVQYFDIGDRDVVKAGISYGHGGESSGMSLKKRS